MWSPYDFVLEFSDRMNVLSDVCDKRTSCEVIGALTDFTNLFTFVIPSQYHYLGKCVPRPELDINGGHMGFWYEICIPADTRRNNNVIMTSKRRRNVVLTSL